jgi:hypothetical protein
MLAMAENGPPMLILLRLVAIRSEAKTIPANAKMENKIDRTIP